MANDKYYYPHNEIVVLDFDAFKDYQKEEELEEEEGITHISLDNIRKLAKIHGKVKCILHDTYAIKNTIDQLTSFYFEDGHLHICSGFASGYLGEGPAGLAIACREFLGREDITPGVISKWCDETKTIIIRGKGNGKEIVFFPNVMDGEYDVVVY